MDFRRRSLRQLADDVRSGAVSARDLTQHALDRIAALNPEINAFVAVDETRALEQAKAVDQMVATGVDPGPLAGIPLGVKDLEDTVGYRTTHGSPLHADDPVATRDSTHVARLRAAGCVVVGKTNTPEYAWSANTVNTLFGATRNPWNTAHSPGGSSGGSAAALAAGMVPLATGSDGGGSLRIPSSACGLSGMKPSLGRVPGNGTEPPGWLDLSTNGPMARSIVDVATALNVSVGPDPMDLRSLPRPEASWLAAVHDPHVPTRVAWSPTLGYAPVDDEVLGICERAVRVLESLGAEVIEVPTIFEIDPVQQWLSLVGVCLARSLESHRGHPAWTTMDPMLAAIADGARDVGAIELVKIFDECHAMNLKLVDLFHDVRLLVTPTCAAVPPLLSLNGAGEINGEIDVNWVHFTYPFNMTRSPAATVCAGLSASGLPVGLQLIGPQHADLVVLRSAAALEAALGFDQRAPV